MVVLHLLEKIRLRHRKDLLLRHDGPRPREEAHADLLAASVPESPRLVQDMPMGSAAAAAAAVDAHGQLDYPHSAVPLRPSPTRPTGSLLEIDAEQEALPVQLSKAMTTWAPLDVPPIVRAERGSGRKAPFAESVECDVRQT